MNENFPQGRVAGIHVSDGGVPKLPVDAAEITRDGLVGDRQRNTRFHGGSERAVCLLGVDVLERLQAEGHPITPGSTGENLTLEGLDWRALALGMGLVFAGGVELEIASYTVPCRTIAGSFRDGAFQRMAQDEHPGDSRLYARVIRSGHLGVGETCEIRAARIS